VSRTRSPWSRPSVSTAGQAASRRAATSSWAGQPVGRRRRCRSGRDGGAISDDLLLLIGRGGGGAGWEAARTAAAEDGAGGEMAQACCRRISRRPGPGGDAREAVGPVRLAGDRVLDATALRQATPWKLGPPPPPPPPVAFGWEMKMDRWSWA
jgi:hypothetical protein